MKTLLLTLLLIICAINLKAQTPVDSTQIYMEEYRELKRAGYLFYGISSVLVATIPLINTPNEYSLHHVAALGYIASTITAVCLMDRAFYFKRKAAKVGSK